MDYQTKDRITTWVLWPAIGVALVLFVLAVRESLNNQHPMTHAENTINRHVGYKTPAEKREFMAELTRRICWEPAEESK